MNTAIGKICPYCQHPIKPSETIFYCSSCSIPHHSQCWQENGRCTTFGCNGSPSRIPIAKPMDANQLIDLDITGGDIYSSPHRSYTQYQQYTQPLNSTSHSLNYPKAPVLGRFIASILDGLIPLVAFIPALIACAIDSSGSLSLILIIIGAIWSIWYSFTKDGRPGGQSIGKKSMGLMVISIENNQPCTKNKSAMRCLIILLLNIVPFVGWLIEPIMVLINEKGQRLGDMVAKTQVIEANVYRML